MDIEFNASGVSISAIVSPISKFSKPTIAQISPASTSCTFLRLKPSKTYNSLILDFKMVLSLFTSDIFTPLINVPL